MSQQTAAQWYWERLNSMSVKEALRTGVGVRCPICASIHPGIRYNHPDHREYCDTDCFRIGVRREREATHPTPPPDERSGA